MLQVLMPLLAVQFVTEGTEEVMQKELPDPAAKLKKKAESAVSKAAAPKAAAEESMSGQFSTQALWPFGLVAVPAGLYALSKVDPGTEKLFEQGWVKVSGFCFCVHRVMHDYVSSMSPT
jgi:hypothetical protein